MYVIKRNVGTTVPQNLVSQAIFIRKYIFSSNFELIKLFLLEYQSEKSNYWYTFSYISVLKLNFYPIASIFAAPTIITRVSPHNLLYKHYNKTFLSQANWVG
jgi:hypothetical protein